MEIGMTPNTYLFLIFPNSSWTISGRLVNEDGRLGISLSNYPSNRPKKTLGGPPLPPHFGHPSRSLGVIWALGSPIWGGGAQVFFENFPPGTFEFPPGKVPRHFFGCPQVRFSLRRNKKIFYVKKSKILSKKLKKFL